MPNLKNHMEEVVFNQMKNVLQDIKMCQCEKCRMDVAAIALNELPPKYVVTEKGVLFSKIDALQQQFEIGVTAAIIRAALLVRKSPWHDVPPDGGGAAANTPQS
ncbi:MAG: late competence development ComFB family protein [Clostridiales bacterium]|nr:late competence development ComFB family protein [Clostridiales bacterium]